MTEPGVEQLPEKWRKRAEKAQELGYTEKAIAVLDCADELEERMDADDGPEIRTDGGVDQRGTDHWEVHLTYPRDSSHTGEATEVVEAESKEAAIEKAKREAEMESADAYPVYRLDDDLRAHDAVTGGDDS